MGIVFDIQKFCVNDGPGIRTVVFLKGCPLKCKWCHNPESNLRVRQLYCDWKKCVKCGKCVQECKNNVHSIVQGEHKIQFQNCKLCGACVSACPAEAMGIYGKEMQVQEVLAEVEKDRAYYENSDGGVTISGGEPMYQFEYAYELAKTFHEAGLHVCMETSGYAVTERYEKIMPYIDLFLLDYKATGTELHRELTGVDNELILKNMAFLIEHGKKVRLRCPIIPGYNLSEAHLNAIAKISTEGVVSVDIIPYHDMGIGKAKSIGSEMYVSNVKVPAQDAVDHWISYIMEKGGKNIHQG